MLGFGLGVLGAALVDHFLPPSGPVSKHTFAFRTMSDDGVLGPWESATNEMREIKPGHFVPAKWTRSDLRKSKHWT